MIKTSVRMFFRLLLSKHKLKNGADKKTDKRNVGCLYNLETLLQMHVKHRCNFKDIVSDLEKREGFFFFAP